MVMKQFFHRKNSICSTSSCPTRTRSSPETSSWRISGVLNPIPHPLPSAYISDACGSGSNTVKILPYIPYGDWGIRHVCYDSKRLQRQFLSSLKPFCKHLSGFRPVCTFGVWLTRKFTTTNISPVIVSLLYLLPIPICCFLFILYLFLLIRQVILPTTPHPRS